MPHYFSAQWSPANYSCSEWFVVQHGSYHGRLGLETMTRKALLNDQYDLQHVSLSVKWIADRGSKQPASEQTRSTPLCGLVQRHRQNL